MTTLLSVLRNGLFLALAWGGCLLILELVARRFASRLKHIPDLAPFTSPLMPLVALLLAGWLAQVLFLMQPVATSRAVLMAGYGILGAYLWELRTPLLNRKAALFWGSIGGVASAIFFTQYGASMEPVAREFVAALGASPIALALQIPPLREPGNVVVGYRIGRRLVGARHRVVR